MKNTKNAFNVVIAIVIITIISIGLSICPCYNVNAQGGVGINSSGNSADPSAILDVSSSDKGTLITRMTTAQRDAISSPAAGLQIFNTDCNTLNFNIGTPSAPIWAEVITSRTLLAGVKISSSPAGAICVGTSVTFTAVPTNGGPSPGYQWKVNDANVGTSIPSYTTSGLSNGDVVSCVMTTNATCVSGSPATSNSITMIVNYSPPSTPGSILGATILCPGSTGNPFSTAAISSSTGYTWTAPTGATITSGQGTNSISLSVGSSYITDNLTVAANNACGTSAATALAIYNAVSDFTYTTAIASSGYQLTFFSTSTFPGATYSWTFAGGTPSSSTDQNPVVTWPLSSSPASYNITLTVNGCNTPTTNSVLVPRGATFNFTGGQQTFTVPSGTTTVTIACWGAQGANNTTPGGLGGYSTGALSVSTGQVLNIFVGGQNGFNGGGSGGTGGSWPGVAGGGASDVRVGGTALSNRIIVAGGGGGGGSPGGSWSAYNAGDGGGTNGGDGAGCCGGQAGGATQGNGGYAGSGCDSGTQLSTAGTLGTGGRGDNQRGSPSSAYGAGSGGGGGYYGGGGGASCGSGGSGGGGSGYIGGVTSASTNPGVNTGNGSVIIAY